MPPLAITIHGEALALQGSAVPWAGGGVYFSVYLMYVTLDTV